jgi:hypothetical protein
MVEVGASSPKLFRAWVSGEHLHFLFVFFLGPHFSRVCVLYFYVCLHLFFGSQNFAAFFSICKGGSITITTIPTIRSLVTPLTIITSIILAVTTYTPIKLVTLVVVTTKPMTITTLATTLVVTITISIAIVATTTTIQI